ncbi:MAG: hypothetical protein FJ076_01275 [Cyanobacteria bacterium K_DeepCast_35m_m1_288]|nr:hypothetical protein [Cyanobacteria bacterium K_DeepCast_35m_m1_288]
MRDEAQRQINLLLQQQEELAPELYRDLALYLQVLREGLLHAVQQACFHLATQVVPDRYNQLPPERRQAFQQRLQELVQRTGTLLTVEQVIGLAAQQQRREHRRQRVQQQRMLEGFLKGEGYGAESSDEADSRSAAPDDAPRSEAQAAPLVPSATGSIHLSLDLPVSADLFERGLPGLAVPQSPSQPVAPEQSSEASEDSPSSEQALLQSLFQMAAEGLQASNSSLTPSSDASAEQEADSAAEAAMLLASPADLDTRVTAASLPRDPLLQLRWWTHFDRALRRRLRNLSHAINVEMLRVGLAQGLLPMNLLDAVLDGQVDALPAPANLLRLPLPLGQVLGPNAPSEVLTLLLRCSDLEYEQPRLRTCRKRLEQRRRALRTMAKRYRSWQRRLDALEAEHQWYQDHAHNLKPAAEPS